MAKRTSRFIDTTFPPELILETIQHIPFGNGETMKNLRQTHPRLRAILNNYERSITDHVICRELPHSTTDFPYQELGYAWLRKCIKSYDVIDDVMSILISPMNCYAVDKHNMALVNTGLLLLYRLQTFGKHLSTSKRSKMECALRDGATFPHPEATLADGCTLAHSATEEHSAKLAFIKSLPRDPLVAIYLAVHHATLTARYHGDGIIHQRVYGRFMDAQMLTLRSDIEFAFSEATLQLGPSFIHKSLLSGSSSAETILLNIYFDHTTHDWFAEAVMEGTGTVEPPDVKGAHRDPARGERSLWTILLERLAESIGRPLAEVSAAIEEITDAPDHRLAWLDLTGKARLVKGENWEHAHD